MRRSPIRIFSIFAILSILLAACRQPTATLVATQPPATAIAAPPTATQPAPTATNAPTATATLPPAQFIGSACPFEIPEGLKEGDNLECGYLSVPANRRDPQAGTLQLQVALIEPPDEAVHPDPIIYLEGGPGGSALEYLYLTYERNYAPILKSGRQLILFDQRGVGYSRPALDCPEQDKLFFDLLDNEMNGRLLSEEDMDELSIEAMATCAHNLRTRADLDGFTTDESAADVADLAGALDFDQVNLWGISYGTRLALEVMRDHPELIRSAVIDSNVPPDANLYAEQPANLARAFNLLFDTCAADAACNAAFPDLRTLFFDTVERLNDEQATFTATDPLGGQSYTVGVTGDNLIDLVFQFMYDAEILPMLPRLIFNAGQGNFDLLSLLVGSVIASQSAISDGMHYVVQCQEEIPFTDPQEILEAAEEFPEYSDYFDEGSANLQFETCDAMEIVALDDDDVNAAVTADIPTLVMAGEYDPVTPPSWSEQVAATLSSSYLYEFPGLSHGASVHSGCPQDLVVAFFDDPSQKPDAACIDAMEAVQFSTPSSAAIELEAFTNTAMNLKGLKPVGWQEVNTGVYARQSSSLDTALVLAQSAPSTSANLLTQLTRQFGLDSEPQSSGQREANGLTWQLYSMTVRNIPVEMALAQAGDLAIVVLLQSAQDEHDALMETVFFPVLDSVELIESSG